MSLWKSGAAVCKHCGLGIIEKPGILGSVWVHVASRKGRCHKLRSYAEPR